MISPTRAPTVTGVKPGEVILPPNASQRTIDAAERLRQSGLQATLAVQAMDTNTGPRVTVTLGDGFIGSVEHETVEAQPGKVRIMGRR